MLGDFSESIIKSTLRSFERAKTKKMSVQNEKNRVQNDNSIDY